MKKIYVSHIIILLISFCSHTEIVESPYVAILVDYLRPNTLVVFDIDNTLARPPHEVGSDQWFCYLVDQKISEGHDKKSAISCALPLCYYAQFNIPLIPTEQYIPAFMDTLKTHNVYTMGLTSRGFYMSERTNEQLNNIGISFHLPYATEKEIVIPTEERCFYKYCTIFSGNNDKGEVLFQLLDIINYHPDHIIFLDDKLYNVESVEKAALKRNVSYIGIRYSGCDELVKNFDYKKAEQQLQALKKRNAVSPKNYDADTAPTKYLFPFNYIVYAFMSLFT